MTMNYNRHCRLEFGEYAQTHEEHDNSLNPHTIGALVLRPTGNVQGGYFFLSQRGFRPIYTLMDGQFEPLHGDLAEMGIQLNTVSNDEHVPEIECQIQTLKE